MALNKTIIIIVRYIFTIILLLCSLTSVLAGDWKTSTLESQGIRAKPILEMMRCIKEQRYDIHSVLIARNGFLVFKSYIDPFKKNNKHELHSITKSIISALIGIAIDKGYLKNVNQKVVDFFPDRAIRNLDGLKERLTVKDLLSMSSGLNCNDGAKRNWAGLWNLKKSNDWTQYTLDLPMADSPGKYFDYCNGASHLLSAIIQKCSGMKTIEFAKKYLFNPLGIRDIKWETGPEGVTCGFGGLWLQPKDLAKIGQLYLNNGKWGGIPIISEEWIIASTSPQSDARRDGHKSRYGYQWWVNPIGYFSAVGVFGQVMYVMPGKDLLAVFTANNYGPNQYVSHSLFREYIITAASALEPLKTDPETVKELTRLVASLAKNASKGIVWLSEKEGIARNGEFKRTAAPAFSFQYPKGSKKLKTQSRRQIMRMVAPKGFHFMASIFDVPKGYDLKTFGLGYAKSLRKIGSRIKVTLNKRVTLKCGTEAYRTDISWSPPKYKSMKTTVISAIKSGKCVYLATHTIVDLPQARAICESLTFK